MAGGAFGAGVSMGSQSENNFFMEFNGPSFGSGRSPCNYAGSTKYPPSCGQNALPASSGTNYTANTWRNCSIGYPIYGGSTAAYQARMCSGGTLLSGSTPGLSPGPPDNLNYINVGSDLYGSNILPYIRRNQFFLGAAARPALWGVKISDRDHLALSLDISPLKICPHHLRNYYPLLEDSVANMHDRMRRSAWTIGAGSGNTTQRHPRQYGP